MIAYFTAFWISYYIAQKIFNYCILPVLDYCHDKILESYWNWKVNRQIRENYHA